MFIFIMLSSSQIERDTFGTLHCHPHPGDFSNKTRIFHCCFFMGLQRKQGAPVNEVKLYDIRATVNDFTQLVATYTMWKPGMEIQVSHVKQKNIPHFVFPGGARHFQVTVSVDGKSRKRKRVEVNVDRMSLKKELDVHEANELTAPVKGSKESVNGSVINSSTEHFKVKVHPHTSCFQNGGLEELEVCYSNFQHFVFTNNFQSIASCSFADPMTSFGLVYYDCLL